ncbi:MAG: hypothetical protein SFX72_19565 [Isosphaeraceae bacterium]|nr:hypothetical protein [Isosphaeraceae bacterium]
MTQSNDEGSTSLDAVREESTDRRSQRHGGPFARAVEAIRGIANRNERSEFARALFASSSIDLDNPDEPSSLESPAEISTRLGKNPESLYTRDIFLNAETAAEFLEGLGIRITSTSFKKRHNSAKQYLSRFGRAVIKIKNSHIFTYAEVLQMIGNPNHHFDFPEDFEPLLEADERRRLERLR